ncbi:MAG: DsbA family oxidoreductase [Gemmatimonadaceae bacterium]
MTDHVPLVVDVYADVVCPWCWIGERRLARALAERPQLRVERRWRPFQLRPELPREGASWADFKRQTFGSEARARAAFAQVAASGADVDVRFDFDRVAHAPNTADAHRTILLAADAGLEWEVAERLFVAHFAEGANLGDRALLAALAAEAGLEANVVRSHLETEEGAAEVQASQREAHSLGVTGVPFVVLDDRYAVAGAQPLETFLRALDTASRTDQEHPL